MIIPERDEFVSHSPVCMYIIHDIVQYLLIMYVHPNLYN